MDKNTNLPNFVGENQLRSQGFHHIAGVDEVGRGPLAGPVVVCALILNPDQFTLPVNDSKKMSQAMREEQYNNIIQQALALSVVSLNAELIDQKNILQATLLAMNKAVRALSIQPDYVVVDGNKTPQGLNCPCSAWIKGDQKSVSIAAASIVAKVIRDKMMARLDKFYPGYSFACHAGYGTQKHKIALESLGIIPKIHRLSFAPVKKLAENNRLIYNHFIEME